MHELAEQLAALDEAHDLARTAPELHRLLERLVAASRGQLTGVHALGRARKVSVSLPEELTAAVQQRVGRGEFSQYVSAAVARQLELDLLAELAGLLTDEHGPVAEDLLAQAQAAWPDVE